MGRIRTDRLRGNLAADLDPLGLTKRELPADLTPEYHGFSGEELDRPIYLGGMLGVQMATVREIDRKEHTSELQSLMRISYAVFCLKKKNTPRTHNYNSIHDPMHYVDAITSHM